MLNRFGLIAAVCLLLTLPALAEDNTSRPIRTPEEEARKQTEMLRMELGLTAAQADTIYLINLRHARLRREPMTRGERLTYMNQKNEELLRQLTRAQQEAYLNKQIEPSAPSAAPRMHQ